MTGTLVWNLTGAVMGAILGAILGAIAGALIGYALQGPTAAAVAAAVGGAVGTFLGPMIVAGILFVWFFLQYRHRYIDQDWCAEHEDGMPDVLVLALRRRAGPAMPQPTIDECWVRVDAGRWTVIKNRELPWMQDRIWYQYSHNHALEPGKAYEVRWFREDGGKFAEVARETFPLRRHEPPEDGRQGEA